MTNSLLLFTFSPIQTFIQEARRAEDLFNGSAILSELAKAAAMEIGEKHLVYPAPPLGSDVPNVIVAQLSEAQAEDIAKNAKQKLLDRWQEIANSALKEIDGLNIPRDNLWNDIWKQQIKSENVWEVYWAVVPFGEKEYAQAYRQASRVIDALKRSRLFQPIHEQSGQKDSLSGKRSALHTSNYKKAKEYWADVSKISRVFPSKVRPNGRERLDAIGAVKRFAELRNETFDSTSTVAAADFLSNAKQKALPNLNSYREKFEAPAFADVFQPRQKKDSVWPYDGDLLYKTTLTKERFKSDYGFDDDEPSENDLNPCRDALKALYETCGEQPSPYYAIIILDGDSMGKKINELLNKDKPDEAHKEFSKKIGEFSQKVKSLVEENLGFLVYNGGDDVMCMAPVSKALPLTLALRTAFVEIMKDFDVTASAGIAISHHQSPLDFAIEEARHAEGSAKNQTERDAVCVHVLKRSGEPLIVRSKWKDVENIFSELQNLFFTNTFSSRLAYAVQQEVSILSGLEVQARKSILKVLLKRQSNEHFKQEDEWAEKLNTWAESMDSYLPPTVDSLGHASDPAGLGEMANWLVLARFLSQRGGEQ